MQVRIALGLLAVTWTGLAGTFGSVVVIGGHAADLALDEGRGLLYVANYTGNRIDVVSTATRQVQTSFNVDRQPSSLSLSPDGRYLVVTHYGAFAAAGGAANVLTVLDLSANLKQTFGMGSPPLSVSFGFDGLALVVTTREFLLLDPVSGATRVLATLEDLAADALPVEAPKFPPDIVGASAAASGDLRVIYGIAQLGEMVSEAKPECTELGGVQVCITPPSNPQLDKTKSLRFRYDVTSKALSMSRWVSQPPLGPRVVSVNRDGTSYLTGWVLAAVQGAWPVSREIHNLAQFRAASGAFSTGSHVIDSARGLVYAQFSEGKQDSAAASSTATGPLLLVTEADNLAVRERLKLPENLAGKSVLSSNGEMMYSVSDSGVMFLPVGSLAKSPRVAASQEDVVFPGTFCDRRVLVQEIDIVDPGGGKTPFQLTPEAGIAVSPDSGITPARVRIAVDPAAFQHKGTFEGKVQIESAAAINAPDPIRVLVNNREPDQRGTVVNVPGTVVDLAADPVRNRFYVLRQDKNRVLVFDGTSYKQIAVLRTGNTPTQMAFTLDSRYLLVGNDDSQLVNVFDLETLQASAPIIFPPGHYPRSIAVSGRKILAASRVAGPVHTIDRIDFVTRSATELPSLGVYQNDIDVDTMLSATASGGAIFIVQANGKVMLYDASADDFVASRKDAEKLGGGYAALSDNLFVAGESLLNRSLVRMQSFAVDGGTSSGFAMAGQYALRATAASASAPGIIQRVVLPQANSLRPTRMTEAPLLGERVGKVTGSVFSRTLAPMADGSKIVALTTSGVTVLPWTYDAAVAMPRIDAIRSAADGSEAVAAGGLVTVTGRDLSMLNAASSEVPLPTALAESCLTVNGALAPMVMVSPAQINAQLPFQVKGTATVVLHTPGGVSNNFPLQIQPAAPTVFRTSDQGTATVVRYTNREMVTLSNPIHPEDWIVIYATGLGGTSPAVEDGYPGPSDPLAQAVLQPEVTLGGLPLAVAYSGLVPGEVGVYQINARVPYRVSEGMDVPLTISQGGSSTTLSVRVVR